MVALFRVAKRSADAHGVVAGALLAINVFGILLPLRLIGFPFPWDWLFKVGQPIVWIMTLAFLLHQARKQRSQICLG